MERNERFSHWITTVSSLKATTMRLFVICLLTCYIGTAALAVGL